VAWTLRDIEQSKVAKLNTHLLTKDCVKDVVKTDTPKKPSPQKDWLQLNLQYWANEKCLEMAQEYKFHEKRKWRFDWAFLSIKVAVEYEGLFSKKSRHTTIKGYQGDIAKYNAATVDGWKVIRVTAIDYKQIFDKLNEIN
jgi:hypothetical protein